MSYYKQKTGGANMETQLYQDRFGVMLYDDTRKILELRWFAETAAMTDDDYMGWLKRYAAAAEQHHAQFLLIDTLVFRIVWSERKRKHDVHPLHQFYEVTSGCPAGVPGASWVHRCPHQDGQIHAVRWADWQTGWCGAGEYQQR